MLSFPPPRWLPAWMLAWRGTPSPVRRPIFRSSNEKPKKEDNPWVRERERKDLSCLVSYFLAAGSCCGGDFISRHHRKIIECVFEMPSVFIRLFIYFFPLVSFSSFRVTKGVDPTIFIHIQTTSENLWKENLHSAVETHWQMLSSSSQYDVFKKA